MALILILVQFARLNVALKDMFDALIIPGGAKGAETISKNPAVQALVREYLAQDKLVGMICAGE